MLNKKNEQKFLKWLFDDYTNRYGYGVRNLGECKFYTTYRVQDLPQWLYEVNNDVAKSHVLPWAKELEIKEFVRFSENGYEFFLTEAGYNFVEQSAWQKFLTWLNKNPGFMSVLAFIVSLGSLCVALFALQND